MSYGVEGDHVVEKKLLQPNTSHAGSPRPLGLQPQASITVTSLDEQETGESFLLQSPWPLAPPFFNPVDGANAFQLWVATLDIIQEQ